jgi:hypothetical protein
MKQHIQTLKAIATVVVFACIFQSCLKDTVTEKYTFYRPIYKTKEAVMNNIKSGAAQAIKQTGKLFIKDNFVFLNDINRGVHIIDYTNPIQPIKVAFVDIPGNVDMAVRGNILYVDCYTSLIALDITNPLNVQKTTILNGVFPHRAYYGFQQDTSLIITEWQRVDTVIKRNYNNNDLTNFDGISIQTFNGGSLTSSASTANGVGGSMARFGLLNDRLYTVSNSDIKVFNTTVAATPTFINTVATGVWDIETIFPFNNNLFLGSNTGMHIFSVANPNTPTKTGTFVHARVCDPVIADNNFAYITLRSGSTCQGFNNQLDVVDIANMSNPTLLKSYPLKNPHGLSKDGNLLFICDGSDGLKIFDATNASNITLLKTIANIDTYDVIAMNGYALVVAKNGLYCIDYRNMNDIKLISTVSITQQ